MDKPTAKVSYLHFRVLAHESQAEYDALLAEYRRLFAPDGMHEDFLVEDMARSHWKMVRIRRIEEHARSTPGAVKVLQRYRTESQRSFRSSLRMLQQERKMNHRPLKDTPERRALRAMAEEGRVPPEIAVLRTDGPHPSLASLFDDDDPFAPRA